MATTKPFASSWLRRYVPGNSFPATFDLGGHLCYREFLVTARNYMACSRQSVSRICILRGPKGQNSAPPNPPKTQPPPGIIVVWGREPLYALFWNNQP